MGYFGIRFTQPAAAKEERAQHREARIKVDVRLSIGLHGANP